MDDEFIRWTHWVMMGRAWSSVIQNESDNPGIVGEGGVQCGAVSVGNVLEELLAIPFGHGGESDMVKLAVLMRTLTSSTDPVETVALLVLEAQVLRHEDCRS